MTKSEHTQHTVAPAKRARLFALVVFCAGLLGEKCLFNEVTINLDPLRANSFNCTVLQSPFPQALAFASDTLWVADASPLTMVPFDANVRPPQIPAGRRPVPIPADSDGNGTDDVNEEDGGMPKIDDIVVVTAQLSFLPTFEKDGLLLFSPTEGIVSTDVSTPGKFTPGDNPQLPNPGDVRIQTGISTMTCINPADNPASDPRDSGGNPVMTDECPIGTPTGSFTRRTSGVAIDSLLNLALVTSANTLGRGGDHQPGVVTVYQLEPDQISPHQQFPGSSKDITTIFTSGFNPTDVVIYPTNPATGESRRFALVAVSGVSGAMASPDATDAFIDVIDIETLQLVAKYPLGAAAISSAGIRIDPAAKIAVVGSAVAREIYAVDLEVLETVVIDTMRPAGGPLDLSTACGVMACGVIFDADDPLAIDRLGRTDCPGSILGLAFNFAGTLLFATDNCDGSFITTKLISGAKGKAHFGKPVAHDFAAPRDSTSDRPRGAGKIVVRPEPLTSYDGPDVFALIDEPEGMVCALFAEAEVPVAGP